MISKYTYVSDKGNDYNIIVERNYQSTNLKIQKFGLGILYEDKYLPACKTHSDAENIADKIAKRWIESYEKTIGPSDFVNTFGG